jgi:hypothetical protein
VGESLLILQAAARLVMLLHPKAFVIYLVSVHLTVEHNGRACVLKFCNCW